MNNYVGLGIPAAWRPLLKALADEGWECCADASEGLPVDCRLVLGWERDGLGCHLSFWHEPEWCGNNFHAHGLTLAALTAQWPGSRQEAEPHALLLTGDWLESIPEWINAFFTSDWVKSGGKDLGIREEQR